MATSSSSLENASLDISAGHGCASVMAASPHSSTARGAPAQRPAMTTMALQSDNEMVDAEGTDDRRLVQRFLDSHDEAAFRELYRAHAAYVYRLALRLTAGKESAAQDIVQDTWMRAVPKLAQFRWQSSLRTWLCAELVNVHREELRRRAVGRRGGHVEEPALEGATGVENEVG